MKAISSQSLWLTAERLSRQEVVDDHACRGSLSRNSESVANAQISTQSLSALGKRSPSTNCYHKLRYSLPTIRGSARPKATSSGLFRRKTYPTVAGLLRGIDNLKLAAVCLFFYLVDRSLFRFVSSGLDKTFFSLD